MSKHIDMNVLNYIEKHYRRFGGTKTLAQLVDDCGVSASTVTRYVARIRDLKKKSSTKKKKSEVSKVEMKFNKPIHKVTYSDNRVVIHFVQDMGVHEKTVLTHTVGQPFTEQEREGVVEFIQNHYTEFGGDMTNVQIANALRISQSSVTRYVQYLRAGVQRND